MKKIILIGMLIFAASFAVVVQAVAPDSGDGGAYVVGGFATFAALAALTTTVTQFVKGFIPGASGFAIQAISWCMGLLLTWFGWFLGLGFLAGLAWWEMLLYGLGISLTANGIFDFGFLTGLLGKKDNNLNVDCKYLAF